jgi:RNA polymerase sigma factor (TIGR02999 family)
MGLDLSREEPDEVARLCRLLQTQGPGGPAMGRLLELLREELHQIAHRLMQGEHAVHTLQTTVLLHEAYARLLKGQLPQDIQNLVQLRAYATTIMRSFLIDYARGRKAQKRGRGQEHLPYEDAHVQSPDASLEASGLHEVVEQALEKLAANQPLAAEVAHLRLFGQYTHAEIAEMLGISKSIAEKRWSFARAWLARELEGQR